MKGRKGNMEGKKDTRKKGRRRHTRMEGRNNKGNMK